MRLHDAIPYSSWGVKRDSYSSAWECCGLGVFCVPVLDKKSSGYHLASACSTQAVGERSMQAVCT